MTEFSTSPRPLGTEPAPARVPVYEHLHFFGARRSGNHAILGWIMANAARNDIEVLHHNDIHDDRMMPPKIPVYSQAALAETTSDDGVTIYSYQDVPYGTTQGIPFYASDPRPKIRRAVVRDLPNLMASRIRMYEDLESRGLSRSVQSYTYDEVAALWVDYAKAYVESPQPDSGLINYPLWFQSSHYRNEVYEALDLGVNHDEGLNTVADFGFGSSFDHQRFDGRAQQMGVLARWEEYEHDPRYVAALTSHADIPELMTAFAATTAQCLTRN